METAEIHTLTLVKLAERSLQEKVIKKNMDSLIAAVNTRSLTVGGYILESDFEKGNGQGWKQKYTYEDGANYRYEMYLKVVYDRRDDKPIDKNIISAMERAVFTKSAQPLLGRWTLAETDGIEYIPPDENNTYVTGDFIGYADVKVPDNPAEYFSHLYGLDAPVKRIMRSIEAAMMTRWESRFHQVLVGPPGCGKSDILGSYKKMFGEEAVLEFDATATTAAGAIKELSERDILPRMLFIEEIEKVEEKQTSHLLSIMDLRAEIRKTTARASIQRDTRILCMATVNNYDLFQRLAAGALASRFGEPIFFQRPSRGTLELILQREVAKMEGDFAWIDPALDYCDEMSIQDVRAVIGICLCGRELLITGEFQDMMRSTSQFLPEEVEDWTS
jgi:ATPase family associated with various cellular activities (AAA)